MELACVTTLDELESLRDEWNTAALGSASPFFDHQWFACAARAFHAPDDLRVFIVRDRGRLVGAAPLAVDRTRRRRLAMIGATALHEPGGWIHESLPVLAELARSVVRAGECVVIQRLPAADGLSGQIERAIGGKSWIVVRHRAPSNGIDTSGRWDEYQRTLSSRTTRRLTQRRESAERQFGSCDYSMEDATTSNVDELIDLIVRVEASGWKGKNGSALAHRADLRAFFVAYARRAAAAGQLRVAVLRFGPAIAAVELAVEAHGRLWGLKVAYDEAFAAFAPGLQLIDGSIRAAFERQLQSYEFVGVAESWQDRWEPGKRHYEMMALYPFSVRAFATAATDAWATLRRGN